MDDLWCVPRPPFKEALFDKSRDRDTFTLAATSVILVGYGDRAFLICRRQAMATKRALGSSKPASGRTFKSSRRGIPTNYPERIARHLSICPSVSSGRADAKEPPRRLRMLDYDTSRHQLAHEAPLAGPQQESSSHPMTPFPAPPGRLFCP